MKDNKNKIIDLLKVECALKGELLNMVLDIPALNKTLIESDIAPTIENCILEINKIHEDVVKLESDLENNLNVKTARN